MMRRLLLALLVALAPSIAAAQLATIAPTPPVSDNGDRIATTAWVNSFVNAGLPLASGKIWIGSVGNIATPQTPSGDLTVSNAGAFTLATVNSNVGGFGNATQVGAFNVNAKGLITSAANVTVTPAISSVTGLGTGVATALGVNTNVTGAFAIIGGALGTPSSATLTSATGLPISTGLTGAGTGVITALGVNVGTAGSIVVNGGALGTPSSGVGSNLTALNATQLTSGTLPAARTNGHQNGTATNDNANAGEVGEYISSTVLVGSAVALTTGTQTTVTSISLTAGDWDVWGNTIYVAGASTVTTLAIGAISTTAATLPTAPGGGGYGLWNGSVTGQAPGVVAGMTRISVASTTTVYLIGFANFTTSTLSVYGFLGARRVR